MLLDEKRQDLILLLKHFDDKKLACKIAKKLSKTEALRTLNIINQVPKIHRKVAEVYCREIWNNCIVIAEAQQTNDNVRCARYCNSSCLYAAVAFAYLSESPTIEIDHDYYRPHTNNTFLLERKFQEHKFYTLIKEEN